MKLTVYTDPMQFAWKADPILARNEDVYSLFYGVLESIKAGKYQDPFMAVLENEGQLVALAQMTAPYPLNIIVEKEEETELILDELAEQLRRKSLEISSVIGTKNVAYYFARQWTDRDESQLEAVDEGIYRLDAVEPKLAYSEGHWRHAISQDASLIEEWFTCFEVDAKLPLTSKESVRGQVASFIRGREAFVWEVDGRVVSMMKKARPTKRGVTVSLVYTPNHERKKGYARSLVANISAELLKEYDFCVLFTDLADPTANKIYREIGYRQIAEFAHVETVY